MALTYKKRKIVQPEKYIIEERELKAPTDWSMYTTKGNKSLQNKAEKLLEKVEKTDSTSKRIEAMLSFLRSYRRMEKTKTIREAGDTAVRECVWYFFRKVCEVLNIKDSADDLWEARDSYPKNYY